ncbi:ATP-binding protein [Streptomyces sp. FIT100]|uniref:ATP-binding protein n=1 Tax=Streptomyces sp. FIT100 TaxID=2837956 RepID=UPI0021C677DF|nr:ATP-binding protein [Streptomyces sp. FIT100]UUN29664.1 ATP-binding protein [Streptomyces sp. FIT100]
MPQHAALPLRHVLTLPAEPGAVRMTRQTAEMTFTEWGISPSHPTVGPALLILSELVTNTVRHAAVLSPTVTITFAGSGHTLAFGVHDRHPHQPPLYGAVTHSGGLGTVIELTVGLGGTAVVRADADGQGKSIWITLPL